MFYVDNLKLVVLLTLLQQLFFFVIDYSLIVRTYIYISNYISTKQSVTSCHPLNAFLLLCISWHLIAFIFSCKLMLFIVSHFLRSFTYEFRSTFSDTFSVERAETSITDWNRWTAPVVCRRASLLCTRNAETGHRGIFSNILDIDLRVFLNRISDWFLVWYCLECWFIIFNDFYIYFSSSESWFGRNSSCYESTFRRTFSLGTASARGFTTGC